MARRNNSSDNTSTTTEQENSMTSTTVETERDFAEEKFNSLPPEDEQAEQPELETQPEPDLSIDEFTAAVETAVEARDTSTGVVAAADLEPVTAAYRNLSGGIKHRNRATAYVEEKMLEAVSALDVALARAYSIVNQSLTVSKKKSTSSPAAPVDPTVAFVQRVAALRLATSLVEDDVADDVADDWDTQANSLIDSLSEQVEAYGDWLENEDEDKDAAPEVSPVVKSAFKFKTGKITAAGRPRGTASGPRRDVGKHILEAFAEVPSGTELKISELAKFKSSEYPEGDASQGAIKQRLFPASGNLNLEGIVAIAKDDAGPNRARKV